jgi:hypothetical protein
MIPRVKYFIVDNMRTIFIVGMISYDTTQMIFSGVFAEWTWFQLVHSILLSVALRRKAAIRPQEVIEAHRQGLQLQLGYRLAVLVEVRHAE